jgi:hypothetical protein
MRVGYPSPVTASAGFRIPLAEGEGGRLVAPEEARRGGGYRCPACRSIVDLHAGDVKRRHYHHRKSSCSAESVVHLSAKRLVVEAVESWRNGGPPVTFLRRCAEGGCEAATAQEIPRKVLRAAEEWQLRSGHVVDVVLLGPADLPIAAVEIVVSHEVDDAKAFELGLPWIEVDGASVCESRGHELVPVRDKFLPWLCESHAHRRGVARREGLAADRLRAALVRALPYQLADFPGYRVHETTRCPRGHDALVFAWDGNEPPWPRPPHVLACEEEEDVLYDTTRGRLRRVLPFRRRWVSVCATCGARLVA